MEPKAKIGTAGWSVPRQTAGAFPDAGSILERYAARLGCVEVNSSFYRPHRRETYARWAASTPEGFRFAVKAPRAATHELRLVSAGAVIERFMDEVAGLGEKLGPLLVQLPPSLAYDVAAARAFFTEWRGRFDGPTVVEPRHPTWFDDEAEALLTEFRLARVAADPACVPKAALHGGWPGLAYFRWHGSPRMYASDYPTEALEQLSAVIEGLDRPAWCIFDNTMYGAATANALWLQQRLAAA